MITEELLIERLKKIQEAKALAMAEVNNQIGRELELLGMIDLLRKIKEIQLNREEEDDLGEK